HGTCPLSVIWEYLGLPGGPGGFTRDFSGPVLLGILLAPVKHFDYGAGTLCGVAFNPLRLCSTCRACGTAVPRRSPATPYMQRLPAITHVRFGLFRFRSPLLSESRLFSLPVGTEMFHF